MSLSVFANGSKVYFTYVKVKFSRYRPGVAQRVGRGIALLFMTAALEGGKWSAARPAALYARK